MKGACTNEYYDVTSLHFLAHDPILLSLDSSGRVALWDITHQGNFCYYKQELQLTRETPEKFASLNFALVDIMTKQDFRDAEPSEDSHAYQIDLASAFENREELYVAYLGDETAHVHAVELTSEVEKLGLGGMMKKFFKGEFDAFKVKVWEGTETFKSREEFHAEVAQKQEQMRPRRSICITELLHHQWEACREPLFMLSLGRNDGLPAKKVLVGFSTNTVMRVGPLRAPYICRCTHSSGRCSASTTSTTRCPTAGAFRSTVRSSARSATRRLSRCSRRSQRTRRSLAMRALPTGSTPSARAARPSTRRPPVR